MAKRASGAVVVEGDAGTVVTRGTTFRRPDGALYESTAEAVVGDDETATVPVAASASGAGPACGAGESLAIVPPVSGLADDATVAPDGITLVGAAKPAAKPPATPRAAVVVEPAVAGKPLPKCKVHLCLNGFGQTELAAHHLGKRDAGHSVRARFPDGEFRDMHGLPELDRAKPTYPSVELDLE